MPFVLLLKRSRPELEEIPEEALLQDRRVQRRDAIQRVAAHDGKMRHPKPLLPFLFDQGHAPQTLLIAGPAQGDTLQVPAVDLEGDLHVPGEHPAEKAHRPFLQGLRQDGVVGVAEGLHGDLPRLIPSQTFPVHQETHQLQDGDRGVGVVELHRHLIGEIAGSRGAALLVPPDDVVEGRRDEEVFLLQAKLPAFEHVVVRVEHLGDRLRAILVGDCPLVVAMIEVVQVELARALCRPEAHVVHRAVAVSGDRRVIGHGHDRLGIHPIEPHAALSRPSDWLTLP